MLIRHCVYLHYQPNSITFHPPTQSLYIVAVLHTRQQYSCLETGCVKGSYCLLLGALGFEVCQVLVPNHRAQHKDKEESH